jgi:hypothetical protein
MRYSLLYIIAFCRDCVVAAAALAAHPLTPQYAYAVIVQAIVVAAASEQHVRSSY